MINIITNIKPTKKLNVEEIIQFVLKRLHVDNVEISVSYNKSICERLSTKDVQINALLDKTPKDHFYNLVLREKYNAPEMICHEMVHLKQYENGELEINKTDLDNYFL